MGSTAVDLLPTPSEWFVTMVLCGPEKPEKRPLSPKLPGLDLCTGHRILGTSQTP